MVGVCGLEFGRALEERLGVRRALVHAGRGRALDSRVHGGVSGEAALGDFDRQLGEHGAAQLPGLVRGALDGREHEVRAGVVRDSAEAQDMRSQGRHGFVDVHGGRGADQFARAVDLARNPIAPASPCDAPVNQVCDLAPRCPE